ncbi:hypothetical protein AX16_009825 [Volvariella volvacea WC 439]|nr:hypothetical protein AX16_009825 [Volvariella volvacea WC 439]
MRITALLTFISAFALPSALSAYIPRAGTDTMKPFFLVSSSATESSNLLPLRTDGTLTSSRPLALFSIKEGRLVAVRYPEESPDLRPHIDAPQIPPGVCATYGGLRFVEIVSTNKCARYATFEIKSHPDPRLGSRLTFNREGAFYACGDTKVVAYRVAPGDGPQNVPCDPIDLWTVPAS